MKQEIIEFVSWCFGMSIDQGGATEVCIVITTLKNTCLEVERNSDGLSDRVAKSILRARYNLGSREQTNKISTFYPC